MHLQLHCKFLITFGLQPCKCCSCMLMTGPNILQHLPADVLHLEHFHGVVLQEVVEAVWAAVTQQRHPVIPNTEEAQHLRTTHMAPA